MVQIRGRLEGLDTPNLVDEAPHKIQKSQKMGEKIPLFSAWSKSWFECVSSAIENV